MYVRVYVSVCWCVSVYVCDDMSEQQICSARGVWSMSYVYTCVYTRVVRVFIYVCLCVCLRVSVCVCVCLCKCVMVCV